MTDQAKLIRLPVDLRHLVEDEDQQEKAFRIIGRSSAGVRLFDVADGEQIVSAVLINEEEAPEEADEQGA